MQARDADGKARPAMEMRDGEVRFREIQGEDVHEAVNVDEGTWRNIIVELKDQSKPPRHKDTK